MQLQPCARCRRHVAVTEHACPFCGEAVAASPRSRLFAARLSRAAVFAGATLAGCHPKDPAAQTVITQPLPPAPDAPPTPPPDASPVDAAADAAVAVRIGTAQIRGVVTDEVTGGPFARVLVRLVVGGVTAIGAAETGSDGTYQLDKVADGDYTLVFIAPRADDWRAAPRPVRQLPVRVKTGAQVRVDAVMAPPQQSEVGPACKPYGAPPARRRVV